jgi:hypothetical protein
MDPYLEHPNLFPGLHDGMITYTRELLQPKLPAPYFAEMSDRVWVEFSERRIGPDVHVTRRQDSEDDFAAGGGTATAVLDAVSVRTEPAVIRVARVLQDEYRESYLEIRTFDGDQERLVTVVEILSPSNKTPGAHGRELYRTKQREILGSQVNLVEIDLLRAGVHTTAVPESAMLAQVGARDYHVCVHRFDRFEEFFVYGFGVRDTLPEIRVPLLPDVPPVPLDLQTVFQRAYETGPYARRVRYGEQEIVPPLRPEDAEWATSRVTARPAT